MPITGRYPSFPRQPAHTMIYRHSIYHAQMPSQSTGSPVKGSDQDKKSPCTGPFFVFRISCFHPSSLILHPFARTCPALRLRNTALPSASRAVARRAKADRPPALCPLLACLLPAFYPPLAGWRAGGLAGEALWFKFRALRVVSALHPWSSVASPAVPINPEP